MTFKVWKVFLIQELSFLIVQIWHMIRSKFVKYNLHSPTIQSNTGGYYIARVKVPFNGLMCPNCSHIQWTKESPFYKSPPTSTDKYPTKLEELILLHGKKEENKSKAE